jgi:hypothetical protein
VYDDLPLVAWGLSGEANAKGVSKWTGTPARLGAENRLTNTISVCLVTMISMDNMFEYNIKKYHVMLAMEGYESGNDP